MTTPAPVPPKAPDAEQLEQTQRQLMMIAFATQDIDLEGFVKLVEQAERQAHLQNPAEWEKIRATMLSLKRIARGLLPVRDELREILHRAEVERAISEAAAKSDPSHKKD